MPMPSIYHPTRCHMDVSRATVKGTTSRAKCVTRGLPATETLTGGHVVTSVHLGQPHRHAAAGGAAGRPLTRRLVADYVATLSASGAPYTVVCRLQELYDALLVLAPEVDWRWLAE